MVVVVAPSHPLAALRRSTFEQLRAQPWAVREPGSGTREASDRWLLEHLGSIEIAFELGSSEALKRLVATGVAVGCLSRYAVAAARADGTLVELRTGLPPLRRRLAIVVHKDKQLGRGAEDFVRHCLSTLADNPHAGAARVDAARPLRRAAGLADGRYGG
jgi:DNA-binding transcriptional LysR family regulator